MSQNETSVQRSCPRNLPQNGREKRKHIHILDTVRALLISFFCPEIFWGEATHTAIYTINSIPSPITSNISPFECLHNHPPDYHIFKVFGSTCFVLL